MRKKLIEKNTPAEWNIRVLTEDDFWSYCDLSRIVVSELPIERHGLHFKRRGAHHIWVSNRLRGPRRNFVLWHELAHFWLHPPGIQFFRSWEDAIEKEADAVAACAMIPRTLLNHYWDSEIAELHGYPLSLVELRRTIFDLWGF